MQEIPPNAHMAKYYWSLAQQEVINIPVER